MIDLSDRELSPFSDVRSGGAKDLKKTRPSNSDKNMLVGV